jgi:hypothetical protein
MKNPKEFRPTKEELQYLIEVQKIIRSELPEYDHGKITQTKVYEWGLLRAIEALQEMEKEGK